MYTLYILSYVQYNIYSIYDISYLIHHVYQHTVNDVAIFVHTFFLYPPHSSFSHLLTLGHLIFWVISFIVASC